MPHAVVVNTIPSAVPRFKSAGGTLNVFWYSTHQTRCAAQPKEVQWVLSSELWEGSQLRGFLS